MNRRTAVTSAAAIVASGVVVPVSLAAAESPDLQDWLDTAPLEAVIAYHLTQLTAAMQRKHNGARGLLNLSGGYAFVTCHTAAGNRGRWVQLE